MPSRAWTAAPTPEGVGTLRNAVAAFAAEHGMPESRVADLKLAVSEVVTNAVVHGYRDGATGSIRATVHVEDDEIVVDVVDQGVGMLPRPDSPGLGLGLPIVGAVTRDLHVAHSEGGGTEVRMVFPRTEAA